MTSHQPQRKNRSLHTPTLPQAQDHAITWRDTRADLLDGSPDASASCTHIRQGPFTSKPDKSSVRCPKAQKHKSFLLPLLSEGNPTGEFEPTYLDLGIVSLVRTAPSIVDKLPLADPIGTLRQLVVPYPDATGAPQGHTGVTYEHILLCNTTNRQHWQTPTLSHDNPARWARRSHERPSGD